jgi:hypothetical protein
MPAVKLKPLPRGFKIGHGKHAPDNGKCVMEAVAYVAGEPHSDHPACACPIITAFLIRWNDDLPDDESRTRLLKPLVKKIVGTRSTKAVELARVMLCVDWLVREWTPAFLRLTPALVPHAEALESLKPIQQWADLDAALEKISAARAAAWDAAWAAAWDAARAAAWAAAWDAARAAAWAAARDAARAAAWAAAWDAARAAARDAARDAARAAAWDAIKPTTEKIQQSAVKLVERMIAVGKETNRRKENQ